MESWILWPTKHKRHHRDLIRSWQSRQKRKDQLLRQRYKLHARGQLGLIGSMAVALGWNHLMRPLLWTKATVLIFFAITGMKLSAISLLKPAAFLRMQSNESNLNHNISLSAIKKSKRGAKRDFLRSGNVAFENCRLLKNAHKGLLRPHLWKQWHSDACVRASLWLPHCFS